MALARQVKQYVANPTVLKILLLGVGTPLALGLMAYLELYSATPGVLGKPLASWPSHTTLSLDSAKPTLVIFAHPQCPCTAASLDELDRLATKNKGAFKLYVVVLKSPKMPQEWNESSLWKRAYRLPNSNVFADTEGVECKRFGVITSGTILLFSKEGSEIFRGGLTTSRGHEGDSPGSDSLNSFFSTGELLAKSTPVYGCALVSESSGASK